MLCNSASGPNPISLKFVTGSALKKPDWLKIRFESNSNSYHIANLGKTYNLHSVCQSAHCPNRSECWSGGTASFMIMGEECTRGCRFCAVKTNLAPKPLDPSEPENLATAIATLNLRYAVVTSVARDDLIDEGSNHFASCIRALKRKQPSLLVEVLVPDFKAKRNLLQNIIDARPDVISHNLETVERLTPFVRDLRAKYRQSLEVLRLYLELSGGKIITKSGLMVGLGESESEVHQTMVDLRDVGVEILTVGQYLQPTSTARHLPVKEYVHPDQFKKYEKLGYDLGFKYVASGPFVRSSYKAAEPFIQKILESRI
ncbi:lipoyl synthase [Candidatus Micrarchaeota archaeon]|nr:lipoyl synthase [Candidatus Micrarchaeota archaeon]